MNKTALSKTVFLALFAIQLLFGLNYIFSKIIMTYLPPLLWGSIRCGCTALILMGVAIRLKKFAPGKAFKNWKSFFIFSMFGIVLNQGCFLLGLHKTTPTNSALLSTLIPVFTILIVGLRGVEQFTKQKIIGFSIAFGGVLILQNIENFSLKNDTFIGDILTITNTIFYSIFLSYSQKFFSKSDFIWATTWLFIFGTPGFLLFSGYDWATFSWQEIPAIVVLAGFANIVLGTVAPYLLISFTMARVNSSIVALFIYIQPLVASVLAYFFFGHLLTLRTFLSALLIFIGVFLVIYRKKTRQQETPALTAKIKVI